MFPINQSVLHNKVSQLCCLLVSLNNVTRAILGSGIHYCVIVELLQIMADTLQCEGEQNAAHTPLVPRFHCVQLKVKKV